MKFILEVTDVPVIFLSAYGREQIVANAFEMGDADYVGRSFSPKEVAAWIRETLRRRAVAEPFKRGDLTVNYARRSVVPAGHPLHLTPTEYRVLTELSAHAGRTLTYEGLLERVWGDKVDGAALRRMRIIVRRLRGKPGDDAGDPTYIFTEHRFDYPMPKGDERESRVSSAVQGAQ